MIRAVFRNGMICPLDPVPEDWGDGRELGVHELQESPPTAEDLDIWFRELQSLTAGLDDPAEWTCLELTLAEADRQAKELVRRDMGLP